MSGPSVEDIMMTALEIYNARNAEYGDSYKHHGAIMMELFGKGLCLQTDEEFARFAIVNMLVAKLYRYATNFHPLGHKDSLDDIIAYAAMLQELDHVDDSV